MQSVPRVVGASAFSVLLVASLHAQQPSRRPITLDDEYVMTQVWSPEVSPDGHWIVYTNSVADRKTDGFDSELWLATYDGSHSIELTHGATDASSPHWSLDGQHIAFLSSRQDDSGATQIWMISPTGGEAERITEIKNGVEDLAWSPDGKRLALVISDGDSVEDGASDSTWTRARRPIVIERFWFMKDNIGIEGRRQKHLYLFDLATRKLVQLTSDPRYREQMPAWSPDGKRLAFVSKRTGDPDRNDDWNLFIMAAVPGAEATQLTTFDGPDNSPGSASPLAFSPDGQQIAYIQGGPPKLIWYGTRKLAVVSTNGGAVRILTPELDRNVNTPVWSSDGKSLRFLFVDDGARQVGEVPAGGGAVRRLTSGRRAVWGLSRGAEHWAVVNGTPEKIDEIYALEGDSLRTLSHHNDAWLARVAVAPTQSISYRSKDGTEIHGFAVTPPDGVGHRPYPTVVNLHGGPTQQHEDDFNFDWQIMAAHGYLVLGPNVRGSSGRGERFSLAGYADWGHKDLEDVLATADWAIGAGLADSARLGVGGYSYGGILTNYVIASTHRFKAAASVAGISDFLASYGTDMWVRESELEVGKPWENTALYLKLSSPFLHADRITTPTLFAGGSADVAVPVRNGMQMYQALRSLGVPTRLVIFPGQYHEGWQPSYLNALLREYLGWYDRFLLGVK